MKHFLLLPAVCFALTLFAQNNAPETIRITPDGELLDANGKLIVWVGVNANGTHISQPVRSGKQFRKYYSESYRWLYEEPVTAAQMQRLGFNMLSGYGTNTWLRAILPGYEGYGQRDLLTDFNEKITRYGLNDLRGWGLKEKTIQMHLPYEIAYLKSLRQMPYLMQLHRGQEVSSNRELFAEFLDPIETFANPGPQPYFQIRISFGTSEGRELMRKIYRYSADEAAYLGFRPFVYKLFNEPVYFDYSDHNLKLFAEFQQKKYKTIDKLNTAWRTQYKNFAEIARWPHDSSCESTAARVEYFKFVHRQVADMCRELKQELRKVDPVARTMVQILGDSAYRRHHNYFDLSQVMPETDVISPGTGNYTFAGLAPTEENTRFKDAPDMDATLRENLGRDAFFRGFAHRKPMINSEAYMNSNTYEDMHRVFWREVARGRCGVIWWAWMGLNFGTKTERHFSFSLQNPIVAPPEIFKASEDVRREIDSVGDLILTKKNQSQAELACLFSYPTVRWDSNRTDPFPFAAAAADLLHMPIEAVFEEQLSQNELDRYKVLLAFGVHATYQETNAVLKRWVERGGVLVMNQGLADLDEYGFRVGTPLTGIHSRKTKGTTSEITEYGVSCVETETFKIPDTEKASWKVLGNISGRPVIMERQLGHGKIVLLAGQYAVPGMAHILRGILEQAGVKPTAEFRCVDTSDHAPYIEVEKFTDNSLTLWVIFNLNDMPKLVTMKQAFNAETGVVNPFEQESYHVGTSGEITLLLPPGKRFVVATGPASEVETRFGKQPVKIPEELTRLYAEQAEKYRKKLEKFLPSVHVPIDAYANAGFFYHQNFPSDHLWEEEGEKALDGFPYHEQLFSNLKFNVIRFDYNRNLTCISLKSKNRPYAPASVDRIPLNGKFREVAFVTTVTHGKQGETACRIRFRYQNGRTAEFPVVVGRDTGDWKLDHNPEDLKPVWKNHRGRGVFLTRWENPEPSEMLDSMDLESTNGESVPVFCAITAVPTLFQKRYNHSIDLMDGKIMQGGKFLNGVIRKDPNKVFRIRRKMDIPADKLKDAVVRFTISQLPNALGVAEPYPGWYSMGADGMIKGVEASTHRTGSRVNAVWGPLFKKLGSSAWPCEVEMPVALLLPAISSDGKLRGELDCLTGIWFGQANHLPQEIKNLRIEY